MNYKYILILITLLIYSCARSRGAFFDAGEDLQNNQFYCGSSREYNCDYRDGNEYFQKCEQEYEFNTIIEQNCTELSRKCVAHRPFISCSDYEEIAQEDVIGCAICIPCDVNCVHNNLAQCRPDGSGWDIIKYCNTGRGEICYQGECVNGCEYAKNYRSNVGCEYWAVDLDNAVVSTGNAASQQFAVVASNPTPIEAEVKVEICDSQPCSGKNLETVRQEVINPDDLEVFLLPPREVDGSSEYGPGNDGTHTALGPRAYKITSDVPIIAYQFNPLDNVKVFSNDATLLIPASGLDSKYTVLGWPQTIANTPYNPATDMGNDLRAFLTIVATSENTNVRIIPTTTVIAGDSISQIRPGETFEILLQPFDVLNLETGGFMSDFTGSIVESDKKIVVFSGSEASDVPLFETISKRECCADHLEHQLIPDVSWGTNYVVPHTPRRTLAVKNAGANIEVLSYESEWYRIIARDDNTEITTTLFPPYDHFILNSKEFVTIESLTHFIVKASNPIQVGIFVASQDTTGIARRLPGGDPSFIVVPPIVQWRRNYVFLTPDKYAFDYLIVMTSNQSANLVAFDGKLITTTPFCNRERADGNDRDDPTVAQYYVFTCQLGFPEILPDVDPPNNVLPGEQNDGVHTIEILGNLPESIGLVVYGFDAYVSYGYTGGTDLQIVE